MLLYVLTDLNRHRKGPLVFCDESSSNLTVAELEALNSLKCNKNIVIKPADKGGAVVICDPELYRAVGLCQLLNQVYYKEINAFDVRRICDTSNEIISQQVPMSEAPMSLAMLAEIGVEHPRDDVVAIWREVSIDVSVNVFWWRYVKASCWRNRKPSFVYHHLWRGHSIYYLKFTKQGINGPIYVCRRADLLSQTADLKLMLSAAL